jgi:pSer/pThr/pTyr-binding forkhead associated (FHA) protein
MAFLLERKGPETGRQFELEKDATAIGRRTENEIFVDSTSVSGRHAVVLRGAARYRVCDLDSTNGVVVNGERVREAVLVPRDVITLGEVEFEFGDPAWVEPGAGPGASASPPTVGLKSSTIRVPSPFESASPFGHRRDFSNIWTGLILLVAGVALGAMIVYMWKFFHG